MSINKYVIAMSGGVDSSVATAILVDQGVNVKGMILSIWGDQSEDGSIPNQESLIRAQTVADKYGIDFEIVDVREEFKKFVINEFINGYLIGLTPNPCVICNKYIKFGLFLDYLLQHGNDNLVTGHYARITQSAKGSYQLHKGKDNNKDQSYFLCMLNQSQLQRSLFPIGEYRKEEVWDLAKYYGIDIAERKESQDLCFLKNQDYREFLKANIQVFIKPGVITDCEGKVIGSHKGLAYYTIGQRKGLDINSNQPMFVLEKDIKNNKLVVGSINKLGKTYLDIKNFNWISGTSPTSEFRAEVKIRSTAKFEWAQIYFLKENKIRIKFDNIIRDITPGQFVVIYSGDQVLGGGEITI